MNVTFISHSNTNSAQTDYEYGPSSYALKEYAMLVGLSVLLIDDQPTSSEQIRDVLRAYGYETRLFRAETNTDILVQLASSPDIIIFAGELSGSHGTADLKLLKLLNVQSINIPLILLTDRHHESLAIDCVKQGAADFVLRDNLNRLGLSVHQALIQHERDLEFKESVSKLRPSETLNRALVDVLPAHIAVLDSQGTIVLVNEAWLTFAYQNRSFSSSNATGVGTNYLDVCWRASQGGDLGAAQALSGIQAVLDGRQAEFSLEYPCDLPTQTLWFKMTVIPVGTIDGGAVISHTDITERKRAEAAKSNAEQVTHALEQERKLRLRYLATLSHDLRTPLTVIKTSHTLLTRYGNRLSEEQEARHQHIISAQIEYLANLVEDIITLDTANEGELKFRPAPVNIRAFCREILEQIGPFASTRHTLSLVLADNLDTALLDEHLLRHALANLLANAVQYSPNGGMVTLNVRRDHDNLIFLVSDQGIGIPPNDLPQLFDAFYRGENVKTIQGTGLGLAIVKSCVEMHNGTINAESALGVGTTFMISVPYR